MGGILYGVDLAMYIGTMRYVLLSKRKSLLTIGLSTALLLLLTIDVVTNSIYGEQAWITFRDSTPGGPAAWLFENASVWYEDLGTTSVAALIFLGDGFLIYRFFILWGSRYIFIVFPIIMYLGGLSMAILEITSSAIPNGSFFGRKAVNFGLPYYTLSITLNVILTTCIIGRLRYMTRKTRSSLEAEAGRTYTGVMAMLIESAALYSIIGFMTIIPYGLNVPTSVAFGQVWAKLSAICPQLILLRVAAGSGWTKETVARVESDIVFQQSTITDRHTSTQVTTTGRHEETYQATNTLGTLGSMNTLGSKEIV